MPLSESRGSCSARHSKYRQRGEGSHLADGGHRRRDIAANARSWGLTSSRSTPSQSSLSVYRKAEPSDRPTMIHIETDLYDPNPPGSELWDVLPLGSPLESTQRALRGVPA